MRILRNIVVGSIFGGSALTIAFTCVDRLDHPPRVRSAGPGPALTRLRLPEPMETGSLPAESGPSIEGLLRREDAPREAGPRPAVPRPTAAREVAKVATRVAAKPAPKPAVKRAAEGFDTERLNALMRGDPAVTLTRSR